MFRQFDPHKAIQAAGVLLRFERNRMSYLRLLKLLYIADREMLKDAGMPLLGSKAVAMKHGPLHDDVYKLVKGIHENTPLWAKFFCTKGYQVKVVEQPDNGLLSSYEVEKLTQISEKYAPFADWDICEEMTHTFSEWIKTYKKNTSRLIALEDIIDAVGRANDKESILEDILELEEFDKIIQEV